MDIKQTFQLLQELNFPLCNVGPNKNPYEKDWHLKPIKTLGSSYGFGLICGKRAKIICLDIDLTDGATKEIIWNKIKDYGLSGRIGNHNKLPSLFFKYREIEFVQGNYLANEIQVITGDDHQVVMPPSIHPNGYPYEWFNKPLYEINIDDLPELTDELIAFLKLFPAPKKKERGQMIMEGEGRNNSLIRHAGILVLQHQDDETATTKLIEYDDENHVPPWFSDTSEPHGGKDPHSEALSMIQRMRKKDEQSNGESKWEEIEEDKEADENDEYIDIVDDKNRKEKYKKITPHLDGLAGELFELIHNSSKKRRTQFSVASAWSLLGNLLSDKCTLDGVSSHLYMFMIAPSGYGKDAPLNAPKKILEQLNLNKNVGIDDISSDKGILMELSEHSARLFAVDEAHRVFDKDSARGLSIRDLLASLYSTQSKYYGRRISSHKGGAVRFGECNFPRPSLLMATTQAAFSKMEKSFVTTGCGARIIYFVEDRPPKTARDVFPLIVTESIKQKIASLFLSTDFNPDEKISADQLPTLKMEPNAREAFYKIEEEITEQTIKDPDSLVNTIKRRYVENLIKIIIINHASIDTTTYLVRDVTMETVLKSHSQLSAVYNNFTVYVGDDSIGADDETTLVFKIVKYITKRHTNGKKSTSKSDIHRRFRQEGSVRKRNEAISSAIQMNLIEIKSGRFRLVRRK